MQTKGRNRDSKKWNMKGLMVILNYVSSITAEPFMEYINSTVFKII